MDIYKRCIDEINARLAEFDGDEKGSSDQEAPQTQAALEDSTEKDTNLDKILHQQTNLKRIIDKDNQVQALKTQLASMTVEIEELRKLCTKTNANAIRDRQKLVEDQAKDVEKYQMGQLRHIAEDFNRHQDILEHRKKEIQDIKKETELEERNRNAYLADVEKKLEKQLQDRKKALRSGSLPFTVPTTLDTLSDEIFNQEHLELTSVDEYAPYGAAPHSRIASGRNTGRATGRGRGRRRRG